MASFHHQLKIDKELAQIKVTVCAIQRSLDFGEAAVVHPNVVDENAVTTKLSHCRDANVVDNGRCDQHGNSPYARNEKSYLDKDVAAQYREVMFQRDKRRSKMVETVVIETKKIRRRCK